MPIMFKTIECRESSLIGILLVFAVSCEWEMSQEIPDAGDPSRGWVGCDASTVPDVSVPDASKEALVRVDGSGIEVTASPDLGSDTLAMVPDVVPPRDVVPPTPDAIASYPDAGKEAAMACPTECFQGCYTGCGSNGQCKSCATCTCEVVTGLCHC